MRSEDHGERIISVKPELGYWVSSALLCTFSSEKAWKKGSAPHGGFFFYFGFYGTSLVHGYNSESGRDTLVSNCNNVVIDPFKTFPAIQLAVYECWIAVKP